MFTNELEQGILKLKDLEYKRGKMGCGVMVG